MYIQRGAARTAVGVMVLVLAAGASWGADVPAAAGKAAEPATVTRQDDKSWLVTGRNYTAAVDSEGNLRSLKVAGREVLDSKPPHKGAAFPGKEPAASVSAEGNRVEAVNKAIRVQYVFWQTGIDVTTEGDALQPELTGITAAISLSGEASAGKGGLADVRKIVLGPARLALSHSFHVIEGRMVPSQLCGRGGKPQDKFTWHVEFGVPVEPAEMLVTMSILAVGQAPYKTPHFKQGEPIAFEAVTENLGEGEVAGEVRFIVRRDWAKGEVVKESAQPAKVAGRQKLVVRSPAVQVAEPGIYWATAEFRVGDKTYKHAGVGLVYEGARYKPALTRPADFREFWDAKLKAMRAVPFDAKLTESPAKSTTAAVHFDLDIADGRGKRIATYLRLPRATGKHDGEVVSYWGSDKAETILRTLASFDAQKPGAGMWERGPDRIRVGAPQPQDSTFTRWAGRDDNNMLDSYLLNVRMADYLRSRDDVAGIWLFGGSRSGPIALATAALDPARVVAVNVHVPTSTGISWAGGVYRGWGSRPDPAVGAYFDAVNFAPDLTVPLLVDGGISDDLAYAPGILAMFNWAEKCPWKRLSIEPGGHGYFPKPSRPDMEKELGEYLKSRPTTSP